MKRFKVGTRWLMGVLYLLAGLNHFYNPDLYLRIMPPYLPCHLELVYLSGAFEVLLGAMILIPRFAVPAAWGLIALLIAVFPANLHMALNSGQYPEVSPVILWARLPLQAALIAWAYWYTRRG